MYINFFSDALPLQLTIKCSSLCCILIVGHMVFKHEDSDPGCIKVGPVHFPCVYRAALLCRTALQIFFLFKVFWMFLLLPLGSLKKKKKN